MAAAPLDGVKAQEFADRMMATLRSGAVALMCGIGHRTRLFDTMAGLPPSTSQEIADAAGLYERYVREWLAAMVTGGIIEYDSADQTYVLPPEHVRPLTRASGLHNLAMWMHDIGLIARAEPAVVECFRSGGGVPYKGFPGIHELTSQPSIPPDQHPKQTGPT
jgi:hypothetical protein